jgi:o-succinylbenzoate synthase
MIKARIAYREFQFLRPATTSRGTFLKKKVYFIFLYHTDDPSVAGIGECSLFPGLSYDDTKGFEERLLKVASRINEGEYGADAELINWPSINFALETAWKDIRVMGKKVFYPSGFTEGRDGIDINGLIWMGNRDDMMRQVRHKIEDGFTCLKMKIGALGFDEELDLLRTIRREHPADELEIRVDANGAFKPRSALESLKRLSEFQLHSIEQPIPAGHLESLASLCESSPIPVALDEELIGRHTAPDRRKMLDMVKPKFIILKPGLLGGVGACIEWISLANERNIKWWVTSTLETNIGLNAIAQWTYTLRNQIPQGLSTGSLFVANISSPLHLYGDRLCYDPDRTWDLSGFNEACFL